MALDPELTKDWLDFEQFKDKYMKVPVEEYPNNVLKVIPNPVVSVRITTYQHVDYIQDAIERVLTQKADFPFEIIIGDDESIDGTREICIDYAEKYPELIRLFLHKRENNIAILGKPSHLFQFTYNSFNLRGKYVAGCSGDDYWTDPLKLQKQVEFMEKNLDFSFCYHPWKHLFELQSGKKFSKLFHSDWAGTILARNIFNGKLPEQFIKVINEDLFVRYILLMEGKGFQLKNIAPSVYRQHSANLWSSVLNTKIERYNQLVEHHSQSIVTYKEIYKAFGNKIEIDRYNVSFVNHLTNKLKIIYTHDKSKAIRFFFSFLVDLKKYHLFSVFYRNLKKSYGIDE